ncbi:ATP-binding protein [Cellulomonas humilata]|uniref:ATP-binding protein n=1 Tax=Cellulomonas humilata TaxID=144055 RepID=A0A7Y6A0S8_9CELL|nr:ATP-binding protein [Cellulomonas humilata]NUU17581.1 ATP-binding protein [Cellulomonas humilata]
MALHLAARRSSISTGRDWIATEARLGGLDAVRAPLLKLLSSELITNAVMHGPALGEVTIRVRDVDGQIRVEVDDESPSPPQLRAVDPAAVGGHGMRLVDAYATRWGCDLRGADGKTVWFDVPI